MVLTQLCNSGFPLHEFHPIFCKLLHGLPLCKVSHSHCGYTVPPLKPWPSYALARRPAPSPTSATLRPFLLNPSLPKMHPLALCTLFKKITACTVCPICPPARISCLSWIESSPGAPAYYDLRNSTSYPHMLSP